LIDIASDQVEFHRLSYVDASGRVFWWQGDLYRAIDPAREDFYRRLISEGVIERLVQERLVVDTTPAEITLDGKLVLRHRSLPFVSHPFEWSPEMLRDAALATIALQRTLARDGVSLQDAHPLNIVFDGSRPLFVDLGSLVPAPAGHDWPALDEFRRYFVNPLLLYANGHSRVARWLSLDTREGVLEGEVEFLGPRQAAAHVRAIPRRALELGRRHLPQPARRALTPLLGAVRTSRDARRARAPRHPGEALDALEHELRSLDLAPAPGLWTAYYEEFPSFDHPADWSVKRQTVASVLDRLRPETVLDVGANRGWFSLLAARRGSSVVAFDTDEHSIDDLHRQARADDLPLQSLVVDVRRALEGVGVLGPPSDRIRCDLVLALAITHHLVFTAGLPFARVVELLSSFVEKHLLVEFVPADDIHVRSWSPETRSWYTLDNFLAALQCEFDHVEVLSSSPDPRVLVFCSREVRT
jgi:SAM-dependent methyltransferase